MRFLPLTFLLATPVYAHPMALTHTHSADWGVIAALALILVAALTARRRALAARHDK